jgi:hypothetical protein
LRPHALIEDALASNAQRTDPGDILAFLDQFNPGLQGTSPLAFAPLGETSVETESPSTNGTPADAERIDAIWGESPQDGQSDEWLATGRAHRATLYRALACDAVQSRAKLKKDQKPADDEVALLMLQR